MTHYRSLSHTKWTCQYHVVFIPKYRKKVIYGELRRDLGEVLRRLAQQRESEVEEGHLMVDHVHIMLSIPPKVLGRAGDRVYQGEERDPHRPVLCGAGAQLRRATLLGSGVLRVHGGSGRTSDSHVYPGPGTGRTSARTAQVGIRVATFRWLK